MIQLKDVENTIDRICKHRKHFKKNGNEKNSYTLKKDSGNFWCAK